MQIRIRCGGHDYEGLSYVSNVPFVMLDMINYRSIDIDVASATAWVQSGATLGELYYAIANKSKTLAFPGGVWSTVGVSGLIGGGGYGLLRRKYGLAADNVIDARIVNADGRILDRKSMGEDLFWAIRGGVASSFGVVMSWHIRLVAVPEIVTVFQVSRTLEQNATQLVHKWQTVAPKLPKDLEIRIVANKLDKFKPAQVARTVLAESTVQFRFASTFLGRIDELLELMNERFPELGVRKEDCAEVSYIQAVLLFSLFSQNDPVENLLNRTSYKISFKAKSEYAKQPLSEQGLNGIWDMLLKAETGKTNLILTSYGGRMDEIPESSIPFPHRAGTLYKIYMRIETDDNMTNAMKWIRSLYDYLGPYVSPRTSYVNYNDLDLGMNNPNGPTDYEQASAWGKKYFKNNFDRLIRVKAVVDPSNFFRHEQSIPIIA